MSGCGASPGSDGPISSKTARLWQVAGKIAIILADANNVVVMTLEEARKDLIERLGFLPTAQDRLMYLVEKARKTPPEGVEFRVEENRVEGCLSNLWFQASAREGKCFYRVDADSHVVRAIAILLAEFYSGRTPQEILQCDPSFLSEAGITQHLSPNRRNGLSRIWDKIRSFALQQGSA